MMRYPVKNGKNGRKDPTMRYHAKEWKPWMTGPNGVVPCQGIKIKELGAQRRGTVILVSLIVKFNCIKTYENNSRLLLSKCIKII